MSTTIESIFAMALGISLDQISDDLEYNSIPEWDSVAHMRLIGEIEDAYDIMLETDDVIDMSSVAMVKKLLTKYDISS